MGDSRINNGRNIWKKIDNDESLEEFKSSSIYKPKKAKESNIFKLYDNLDDETKKRNINAWKAIVIISIIMIGTVVFNIIIYHIK